MPPNQQIKAFKEIWEMAKGTLTKEEFVAAFKEVLKVVKDIKDTNSGEWKAIHQAMQKIPDKMMSEMMSEMSKTEKKMVKECMDKCEKMCSEMEKKHKAEMGKMDMEVRMIKADRESIIEDALAKVPVQTIKTPVELRDELESLIDGEKLSIQAIQDLPKLLDELTQRMNSARSGASLISKRIRFIDDETPSGTVNKSPETGSLKVYVNGQRMRVTEDYTLSDKTITFNTAPPIGSIILCDYRY